ncbi:hypothetical protein DP473_23280, partial [Salmonella enterica]|nr:hypothetical protein [Salmonella enterica]
MILCVFTASCGLKTIQNWKVIYQKNLSPGPFEITDTLPTVSGGDLNHQDIEADGRSNSLIKTIKNYHTFFIS